MNWWWWCDGLSLSLAGQEKTEACVLSSLILAVIDLGWVNLSPTLPSGYSDAMRHIAALRPAIGNVGCNLEMWLLGGS